jgi:hypothetical protein
VIPIVYLTAANPAAIIFLTKLSNISIARNGAKMCQENPLAFEQRRKSAEVYLMVAYR